VTLSKRELPELQFLNPTRYERVRFVGSSDTALVFHAESAADYDWLEEMILEHGFYELPGVWSFAIDEDKQIIAEIAASFAPKRTLELGCASGPVLKLLNEAGIDAEGVEISQTALASAYPEIKEKIHFGDLLNLDLHRSYDLIIAMDIYEHLNPNKIDAYIDRCFDLLVDGGVLFTNIPAFGPDPVFGEVFPAYLEPWQQDVAGEGMFSALHVDDRGWPRNGHLIWATAVWWRRRFEFRGFAREAEAETSLHQIYDPFYAASAPARKSFFLFSKNAAAGLANRLSSKKLLG